MAKEAWEDLFTRLEHLNPNIIIEGPSTQCLAGKRLAYRVEEFHAPSISSIATWEPEIDDPKRMFFLSHNVQHVKFIFSDHDILYQN